MKEGDCMIIIRREDEEEVEWWWARFNEKEGYVLRNLLGVSILYWEVFLRVETGCVKIVVCYEFSVFCCFLLLRYGILYFC